MSKEENLIHIKIEYPEAVKSKRELLSSELRLLNITKISKRYLLLRKEEAILKTQFYKEIKNLSANIKKLEALLPQLKIPKILKQSKSPRREFDENEEEKDIQKQLRDIQEKLRALS